MLGMRHTAHKGLTRGQKKKLRQSLTQQKNLNREVRTYSRVRHPDRLYLATGKSVGGLLPCP
jgi:hypothetical protein